MDAKLALIILASCIQPVSSMEGDDESTNQTALQRKSIFEILQENVKLLHDQTNSLQAVADKVAQHYPNDLRYLPTIIIKPRSKL